MSEDTATATKEKTPAPEEQKIAVKRIAKTMHKNAYKAANANFDWKEWKAAYQKDKAKYLPDARKIYFDLIKDVNVTKKEG